MENKVVQVDARGMRCPWPALRAARMLREHAAVQVFADDPAAPGELRSLARQNGWALAEEMTGMGISFHISR